MVNVVFEDLQRLTTIHYTQPENGNQPAVTGSYADGFNLYGHVRTGFSAVVYYAREWHSLKRDDY